MPRDVNAEMRAIFDREMASSEPMPLIATRIVEDLRRDDPELLTGWLDGQAVSVVRDALNWIDRSTRAHVRATGGRGVFAEAAATGDMTNWLSDNVRYVISEKGDRKSLKAMEHGDLTFVAEGYGRSARESAFEEAFFRALARKVTTGRVEDHYTEEQIAALRSSLASPD